MSYVLMVPNSFSSHYRADRNPHRVNYDAYLSKQGGVWTLDMKIKRAHRWKTKGRAETALMLLAPRMPEIMGKVVVVEVEKTGDQWHLKRSSRDW